MIEDGYEISEHTDSNGDNFQDPCSIKINYIRHNSADFAISGEEIMNIPRFCKSYFNNKNISSEWKIFNNISHPNLMVPMQSIKSYYKVFINTVDLI